MVLDIVKKIWNMMGLSSTNSYTFHPSNSVKSSKKICQTSDRRIQFLWWTQVSLGFWLMHGLNFELSSEFLLPEHPNYYIYQLALFFFLSWGEIDFVINKRFNIYCIFKKNFRRDFAISFDLNNLSKWISGVKKKIFKPTSGLIFLYNPVRLNCLGFRFFF